MGLIFWLSFNLPLCGISAYSNYALTEMYSDREYIELNESTLAAGVNTEKENT